MNFYQRETGIFIKEHDKYGDPQRFLGEYIELLRYYDFIRRIYIYY